MTLPEFVGVFGGGRMGAGIAHAFVLKGANVVVIEVDEAAVSAAAERIATSLTRAAERGTLEGPLESAMSRVTVASDTGALARCGLVVEAVPELAELKTVVLKRIEAAAPEAVVATNTSSLSIDGLAAQLSRPERFLGLHFFNPVPASDLVEIVRGGKTSGDLVISATKWVSALGKTPIVVSDAPGFASSRLGVAIALEAMRMVQDGVASAEDIDLAMTLGYKHPMGPLRTTDIVGLDVRLAIAEHLARELGPRFDPPEVLRAKVADGQLGRKSGQGFYTW